MIEKIRNCYEVFISFQDELRQHMKDKHGESHTCTVCGKAYSNKSSLTQHRKDLHPTEEEKATYLQCNECQGRFRTKHALTQHQQARHGKGHICPMCHRNYTRLQSLNEHIRTHQGQTYKCGYKNCDRQFKHSSSLANHVKAVHRGGFPCPFRDVDGNPCDHLPFTAASALNYHKRRCVHRPGAPPATPDATAGGSTQGGAPAAPPEPQHEPTAGGKGEGGEGDA